MPPVHSESRGTLRDLDSLTWGGGDTSRGEKESLIHRENLAAARLRKGWLSVAGHNRSRLPAKLPPSPGGAQHTSPGSVLCATSPLHAILNQVKAGKPKTARPFPEQTPRHLPPS